MISILTSPPAHVDSYDNMVRYDIFVPYGLKKSIFFFRLNLGLTAAFYQGGNKIYTTKVGVDMLKYKCEG